MQLRIHQQDNLNYFREMPRAISLLPFGAGKSPVGVLRLGDLVPPRRVLLVTTSGTVYKWAKELKEWGNPLWKTINLIGRHERRIRLWQTPHNIAIINYEGMRVMLRQLGRDFLGFYKVILFDEIHRLKNPQTGLAKDAATIAHPDHADYVYGLTGSPVLESPTDIFSIMRVINPSVFGMDFDSWREIYFELRSSDKEDGTKSYPKWHAREGALDFLSHHLHQYSFRRERNELDMDFPEQIFADPLIAQMTGRTRRIYDHAQNKLELALRHEKLSLRMIYPRLEKLCQISRGWAYDSMKIARGFREKPVIKLLGDYLEDINGSGRPVIWAVRMPDFAMIGKLLKSRGMSYRCIHGDITMKQRAQLVAHFNDGHFDTLVCHPRCVGEGIDLQANYSFRYSYRWSVNEYEQPLGRFARYSSTANWVHYTDAVVLDSPDERILESIKAKSDIGEKVKTSKGLPWMKRSKFAESIG